MSVTRTTAWTVNYVTGLGDFSEECTTLWFLDEQSATNWVAANTGFDEWGYELWDDHATDPCVSQSGCYDGPLTPDEYGVVRYDYQIIDDPDRDQLIAESRARRTAVARPVMPEG